MATTFDHILLDPLYSADAEGGPEFATAIIRSGQGGAVSQRNANREDYVSRYDIDYRLLTKLHRQQLRQFAILREGMKRGFRFLAPDDSELEYENLGYLNPSTGSVEYLASTDGSLDTFYLIKHYSDPYNNYTRRILLPSPYEQVVFTVLDAGDSSEIGNGSIPANTAIGAFGVINPTVVGSLSVNLGIYGFTFNFHLGKLVFDDPVPAGWIIRISCQYHLPVAFATDIAKFSVDDGGTSELKISVEELLPAELGVV